MDMKPGKCILRAVLFLGLLLLALWVTQNIFTSKFRYPQDADDHEGRYQEYFSQDKGSVDALFLGTSHAEYAVSPMEIYRETGIRSFNLASSLQEIGLTYSLLQDALRTQSPKAVLLDASLLYLTGFDNGAWRKVLDSIPLSQGKIAAAKDYARVYTGIEKLAFQGDVKQFVQDVQSRMKAFGSVLFPLYYYHSRWSELTQHDFDSENASTYCKGYYINSEVNAPQISEDRMNEIAEAEAESPQIWTTSSQGGQEMQKSAQEKTLYQVQVPSENKGALMRIRQLCEQNGAELILFKAPVIVDPRAYNSSWTRIKSNQVHDLAREDGIPFLDLQYDEESADIDPGTCFKDGGYHLNYRGARIVSEELAAYLQETVGIAGRTSEVYDASMPVYEKAADAAELQLEKDFDSYLQMLKEREDSVTVLLAADGDAAGWLTEDQRKALRELGLQADLSSENRGKSYAAVIEKGQVLGEKLDDGAVKGMKVTLKDGTVCSLSSAGSAYTVPSRADASIKVKGKEYAQETYGLNIVVYEEETGKVIDSAAFSPSGDGTACRKTDSGVLLKEYEHHLYDELRKAS